MFCPSNQCALTWFILIFSEITILAVEAARDYSKVKLDVTPVDTRLISPGRTSRDLGCVEESSIEESVS